MMIPFTGKHRLPKHLKRLEMLCLQNFFFIPLMNKNVFLIEVNFLFVTKNRNGKSLTFNVRYTLHSSTFCDYFQEKNCVTLIKVLE